MNHSPQYPHVTSGCLRIYLKCQISGLSFLTWLMLSSLPSCALKPRAIPSTILHPPRRSVCPIYQISQDEAPRLFYLKSAAWQSSFTLGLNWIYRAWLLSSEDLGDLCWGFGRLQVFCFSPVSPSSPSASDLFQTWKMKALFTSACVMLCLLFFTYP